MAETDEYGAVRGEFVYGNGIDEPLMLMDPNTDFNAKTQRGEGLIATDTGIPGFEMEVMAERRSWVKTYNVICGILVKIA